MVPFHSSGLSAERPLAGPEGGVVCHLGSTLCHPCFTVNPLSWSFAALLVNCLLSEHTEATYPSAQIPVQLNRTQGWCPPLFLSLIPISSTNYLGPFLLAKCILGRPVGEEERGWQ